MIKAPIVLMIISLISGIGSDLTYGVLEDIKFMASYPDCTMTPIQTIERPLENPTEDSDNSKPLTF